MNINDAFPSKNLKASDLNGAIVAVTISHIEIEEIGQKKERKPVLYFEGKTKGLVLNKTNSKRIAELLGSPDTDDWTGQRIALYPSETEFQGETVDCIRVKAATAAKGNGARPKVQPEPEPEIAEEDLDPIPF